MIDRMMSCELSAHLDVIGRFVSVQRALAARVLNDERTKVHGVDIRDMLRARGAPQA
jgi:hypothetical protein